MDHWSTSFLVFYLFKNVQGLGEGVEGGDFVTSV